MPTVNPLQQDLEHYLMEAVGLQVTALAQPQRPQLPHFLSQLYEPHLLRVGSRTYLGVFLREGEAFKPASFEKHVSQLPLEGAEGVFLVAKGLPGYVRKRLIERKISFVIPGSQLYFPELGMELRPRSTDLSRLPANIERMSPATQLVVLYALNNHLDMAVSPLILAKQSGYTAMTMTRAWNELESMGLGRQVREGKQRLLSFPEGRKALWEKARALMRNPVQESVRLLGHDVPNNLRWHAGESALADLSMLAPPKVPVYAVSREDWKTLEAADVQRIPVEEPGTCMVQIWRYPPKLLGMQWCVDPVSLFLSLEEETDERVQAALVEMMEQLQW